MSLHIRRIGPAVHYIPSFEAGPGGTRVAATTPVHFAEADGLPASLDAIICTSDLQGREVRTNGQPGRLLGEAVAEELEVLLALEGLSCANAGVLLAGDYYAAPGADRRGVSGDIAPVWRTFAERSRWVCGVLGNHDRLTLPPLPRARLLQQEGIIEIENALTIAGLDYIIGDAQKPGRRSEAEYLKDLRRKLQAAPQILVLHESPAIPEASEFGSEVIARELKTAGNTLVVCGHVRHRQPLHNFAGEIQVLNVDGRVVVLRRSLHY